jgi:hypothetical protein
MTTKKNTEEVIPDRPLIYARMAAVMRDVGAVGKNRRADRYQFRGVDDVMQALQPVLVKHGVVAIPTVLERESSEYKTSKGGTMQHSIIHVRYDFYAEDGSNVSAVAVGEGADIGDKSCNKAMAGALKYCLTQSFCIPTEEPKDSELDDVAMSRGVTLALVRQTMAAAETVEQFRELDPLIRGLSKEDKDTLRPEWQKLDAEFKANGAPQEVAP